MGKNVLNSSGGRKKKNAGKKNKWQMRQEARHRQHRKELTTVQHCEGAEFLAKKQLKDLVRQPTNSIRPSGKRMRKVLKRIGHQKRQDRKMDVEMVVEEEKPTKKKAKKGKVQMMDVEECDTIDEEQTGEITS